MPYFPLAEPGFESTEAISREAKLARFRALNIKYGPRFSLLNEEVASYVSEQGGGNFSFSS